ncbi:hypothetical protein Hanom_Chr13g01235041 [Helianthus anomalus]
MLVAFEVKQFLYLLHSQTNMKFAQCYTDTRANSFVFTNRFNISINKIRKIQNRFSTKNISSHSLVLPPLRLVKMIEAQTTKPFNSKTKWCYLSLAT